MGHTDHVPRSGPDPGDDPVDPPSDVVHPLAVGVPSSNRFHPGRSDLISAVVRPS